MVCQLRASPSGLLLRTVKDGVDHGNLTSVAVRDQRRARTLVMTYFRALLMRRSPSAIWYGVAGLPLDLSKTLCCSMLGMTWVVSGEMVRWTGTCRASVVRDAEQRT